MESPVKTDFRLSRRATTVGDVDIAAGTPVMVLNGAANRDPRRFECPAEFRIDRANAQSHIAFGRGNHSCPGGPLARAEGRVSLERILDRTRDIRLSDGAPRPAGQPPLPVHADLGAARPRPAAPRVHAGTAPLSRARSSAVRVRSSRFRTLPDGFRGSASTSTTSFGTLNRASCARQCSTSSSGVVVAAGADDDVGDRNLAPSLVGAPDDGRFDHRLVLVQHALDLGAGDVLAAGHDHVLEPVDDVEVPVVVLHADVAGVEPTARERRTRSRRGRASSP